jgi:hypothetical protein
MSAGQVWRRHDGLLWVELQTAAIEVSGWRLMAPLVDRADAPDAPPLIVTVDRWRARLHLLTGAPERVLGELLGALTPIQTATLQHAARQLLDPTD